MDRPTLMSDELRADMEDRAAELVDRDRLLGQERVDWQQGRAEQFQHDCDVLVARAVEWEAIKARSGHQSDYGWWGGVL